MKKLFTLILALVFGFGLKAQCPLTTAVDFTATDCHGTEVHLFDILDGGQAVLIDFFFVNCGPCQQATPKVVESYYTMGCNMHDVFYIEISDRDSDVACQNWVNNYAVEYPTISGPAGGSGICSTYQIGAFPTVILIMPDRSIAIQDLWPISNAQTIVNQLGQHGVMPHDCNEPVTYDPQVTLSVDEVTETSITATFSPNEDCASFYYLCATEAEIMEWVAELGEDLPAIMQAHGTNATGTLTHTFNDLIPDLGYFVMAHGVDADGNFGNPAVPELVFTLPEPIVYDETLTFSMDTANIVDNQYGITWITVYNNTAEDAIVTRICDEFEWLAFNIDGEDVYCYNPVEIIIPQGESKELGFVCNIVAKNIVPDMVTLSSNLPDASFVVMLEEPWSVNENVSSATLFPNPANESVTLKGKNLGMVRIFNVLGQKVNEFEANGSEVSINTTGYENGIYFVKTDKTTLRFVVTH